MDTSFYEEFEDRLANKIAAKLIETSVLTQFSPQRGDVPDVRYLKKVEARKYLGGIDNNAFDQLILLGLKQVRLATSDKRGSIRYDVKELDRFMSAHKI